jgi:hypothetical protein
LIFANNIYIQSLKFLLVDNKNKEPAEKKKDLQKLSRLDSVSKHHYLSRKKSRKEVEEKKISLTTFSPLSPFMVENHHTNVLLQQLPPPPSNSTLVDLSNSQSNFLTHL